MKINIQTAEVAPAPQEQLPKKEKGSLKKFIKNNYTGWLFNLPLVIGLLAFTLIPGGYSLYISFGR